MCITFFRWQVGVHTVKYRNVPLPQVVLLHSLCVCFLWREAAIHRRSWSIIPRTLSFSLLQDSSHFAKHQVQKLQCRRSWPPLHIPLYIFDVFSLLSTRELCGEIHLSPWEAEFLRSPIFILIILLFNVMLGSAWILCCYFWICIFDFSFQLKLFFLLLSGWTTWLKCSKSGSAWIFLSFPFAVLCYSRWESDRLLSGI